METNNNFYIFKDRNRYGGVSVNLNKGYSLENGEEIDQQGSSIIYKHNVAGINRVLLSAKAGCSSITMLMWDANSEYIGYEQLVNETVETINIDTVVPENTQSIGFMFDSLINVSVDEKYGYEIHPHYKQIKKSYKKQSSEMFFRETLDGQITLFGVDYLIVANASLEDTLIFKTYKNNKPFVSATFNKSDCKFNHFAKSVQPKLSYYDSNSSIMDAYENTYDLIKLAPALTPITLTKRCVAQIYIQGENVVSSYAGGTYWETEVDEVIDDEDALTRKYYFSKGPRYVEVSLEGFNTDINTAYTGLWDSNIWKGVTIKDVGGTKFKVPCEIRFVKVGDARSPVQSSKNVHLLSTGKGDATYSSNNVRYYTYDSYKIQIWVGSIFSTEMMTLVYESVDYFGKDVSQFTLAVGDGLYPMTKHTPVLPVEPEPATFNLGENVIEYQIWGRLLCDSEYLIREGQDPLPTYDLPRDDFATPRRNYRKCIGIIGFNEPNSVIKIYQSQNVSNIPTSYGITDFGEYFMPPYSIGQYFFPLSRSAWGNTSLWVVLDEMFSPYSGFEHWCSSCYKEFTIKDCYHIADAIKAILKEIDPTLTHENTAEYSSFLYGHTGGTAASLGGCDIYITQKTNVLKGEYDQAAQKAEITFKQLMEMLRDCFRCYWFIDDQNRFRIEHVSYFMSGQSYDSPQAQIDLTQKRDKFNKKLALYAQKEIEYDKSELTSRYEFSWMDDCTKAMGSDLHIDVHDAFIQKDKTDEINISKFSSDVDYMLFLPDDFSNEGFALLLADSNKKVPIVHKQLRDEKQFNTVFDVYVQNWYASFNQLIWHYMEDLSGGNISCNNIGNLYVGNIKRSMKHTINIPELSIDVYKTIITDFGNGHVESASVDIDTNETEIELRYRPT